jgi:hypothetical protein
MPAFFLRVAERRACRAQATLYLGLAVNRYEISSILCGAGLTARNQELQRVFRYGGLVTINATPSFQPRENFE